MLGNKKLRTAVNDKDLQSYTIMSESVFLP
jgi:hypothetical protein